MSTEDKGITIADAFDTSPEELEKEFPTEVKEADVEVVPVIDKPKDGEVEETGIESETKKVADETVVEETVKTVEPKKEQSVAEKTWTELGLPQYEGMTKEQVAERISLVNREFGRATNTIGYLRKQIISAVHDTVKPADVKDTKTDILASMPNLSESDAIKFNEMYEVNPAKAIFAFGGDTLKQIVRDELENSVPNNLNEILNKRTEQERFNTFLTKNNLTKDSSEIEWMKEIDTNPEYLGGQNRAYDELFELCSMKKSNADGVEEIFSTMKRHPTLSIAEAKIFIGKKVEAVPTVKTVSKDKIKETVQKLNNANSTSQTAKIADDIPTYGSVEEAFNS
jgi:hypothetical protein